MRLVPLADDAAWRAALSELPADVYHDPAYVAAAADGADAVLAVAGDGADRLVVPLILRRLPAWLGDAGCDAESPYGYAAPLVSGNGVQHWPVVRDGLAAAGVVNVFLRGHPGSGLPLPSDAWLMPGHPTVAIPLNDGEPFAGGRCATQRSQVQRAGRAGLHAEVVCPVGDLSEFRRLYDQTMARLEATDAYRFGDGYYATLAGLGERLALITVRDGANRAQAAAMFFAGPEWAHYHLSGRDAEGGNLASHLLFPAAATWAAARGCRAIHLGGGTSADPADPLLAFKRRIGRADHTFAAGGVVCDQHRHQALLAAWSMRSGTTPRWFQGYRQPLPLASTS